jgi:hypothetical protein
METHLSGAVGSEVCSLDLRYFEADCKRSEYIVEASPNIECECCTQCYISL